MFKRKKALEVYTNTGSTGEPKIVTRSAIAVRVQGSADIFIIEAGKKGEIIIRKK